MDTFISLVHLFVILQRNTILYIFNKINSYHHSEITILKFSIFTACYSLSINCLTTESVKLMLVGNIIYIPVYTEP